MRAPSVAAATRFLRMGARDAVEQFYAMLKGPVGAGSREKCAGRGRSAFADCPHTPQKLLNNCGTPDQYHGGTALKRIHASKKAAGA